MRKFPQLYRREFSLRVWQSWLLVLAALSIQPLLTGIAGVRYGERFETVYDRSAAPAAVTMLTALAVGWMVYSVLRDFRGGMDTLLTLPCRREWVYLAKMAAFCSLLLVLFAGLLGGVFASYGVYLYKVAGFPSGPPWPMENGLLLALCRSDALRLLFPLELWGLLSNLLLLTVLAAGTCYAGYLLQAKRVWGLLPLAAAGLCWTQAFRARLGDTGAALPEPLWHAGLLAALVFLVLHSLWMIRRADF